MKVDLKQKLVEELGEDFRDRFGFSDSREWSIHTLSLTGHSDDELTEIYEEIKSVKSHGSRTVAALIKKFIKIRNGKFPRASGATQMEHCLESYIALHAPQFRLYNNRYGRWYGYHVERVWYTPERKDHNRYYPATVSMELRWVEFGTSRSKTVNWETSKCRTTAPKLLADSGYVVETDELREEREADTERYKSLVNRVGLQCLCDGYGFLRESRKRKGDAFQLGIGGESTVVIDILDDDEGSSQNHRTFADNHQADSWSWERMKLRLQAKGGEDLDDEDYEDEDCEDEGFDELRLPLHPMIPCFDLNRHEWYDIHVTDLTVYKYDKSIYSKLILPQETKDLVAILAKSSGSHFKDVVSGKSGGTTVLLAGPPGVGKTLTAEVYAEAVEKPLYRVQCSQLGVDPENIENELLDVFRRAGRWNAITLLDEADVYIRSRDNNLAANAIVGVFLRVLEYQNTVLFMTTNLPESVDDAIASRCIARIDYDIPNKSDLLKIWKVLSETASLTISDKTIQQAVDEFPSMAGRDVKNTLKLVQAHDNKVTIEAIRSAARFHPNRGNWREQ